MKRRRWSGMLLALLLPKAIWGAVQQRWDVHLLSAGYRVRPSTSPTSEVGINSYKLNSNMVNADKR